MSDEYRRVLLTWAANRIPADWGAVKITDVQLQYEHERAWSAMTGEDSSFDVLVTFTDSAGRTETRYLPEDGTDAARSMSTMLAQLFAIADLQGDEIRERQTRITQAQAAVDAHWDHITRGAQVALFWEDRQMADWEEFQEGRPLRASYRRITVDAAVFRNDNGEHRVPLTPNGRPLVMTGAEFRLSRPVVSAVSVD